MRNDTKKSGRVPNELIPNCTYPVVNPLAVAARPKLCSKPGPIIAGVPYIGEFQQPVVKMQNVCLEHACEIASWKLVQALPEAPFTQEEIEFMISSGADREKLMMQIGGDSRNVHGYDA